MATFTRFGRRFSVPSTVQILHELRALSAIEDARASRTSEGDLSSAPERIEPEGELLRMQQHVSTPSHPIPL